MMNLEKMKLGKLSAPPPPYTPGPYFNPLFFNFADPPSGGDNQNLLPPFKKRGGGRAPNYE